MTTDMKQVVKVDEAVLQKLRNSLEERGFDTVVLNSEKEVKDFINTSIPDEQIVGLGDSITTCTLNIRNILFAKGSKIFYSWDGSENYNRSLDTFETPTRPSYYLSRINAVTLQGEILMKDYSKEAAEDQIFPDHIFAFAGLNRLCEKLEERESLRKYPVIGENPGRVKMTVALLPFLNY